MAYPSYYQPYQNPYFPQYQPVQQVVPQTAQQTNVVEVGSESEASAYLVAAGSSVLLWNKKDKRFYYKSRDMSGSPLPMLTMSYSEDNAPQKQATESEYVSRDEFQALADKVTRLEQKPVRKAKVSDDDT
jgi:hypothetical protein